MAKAIEGDGEQFLVHTPEGGDGVWTIEQICQAYEGYEDGFRPERIWHLPEARPGRADGRRVEARIEVEGVGRAHDERCGAPTFDFYELRVRERWADRVLARGEYTIDLAA